MPDAEFRQRGNELAIALTEPHVKGVFEEKLPLALHAALQLGCVAAVAPEARPKPLQEGFDLADLQVRPLRTSAMKLYALTGICSRLRQPHAYLTVTMPQTQVPRRCMCKLESGLLTGFPICKLTSIDVQRACHQAYQIALKPEHVPQIAITNLFGLIDYSFHVQCLGNGHMVACLHSSCRLKSSLVSCAVWHVLLLWRNNAVCLAHYVTTARLTWTLRTSSGTA